VDSKPQKRLKETRSYAAISTKGRAGRKRVLKNEHKEIQEIVAQTPDATQGEIAEQLPVKVHQSMVGRELRLLKLTDKKNGVCR
jgi:transposase